ncbi:MAG: signal recognition particle-docking protein FtsY, partial [Thermodesulfobacteria bacterium]|nr:signal recognition particle-docking protein FtsY [Thermodesulfobacteriota bacterium]
MLKRLKEKISRSRNGFIKQLDQLFLGKKEISPELLEEIEEILVMADMGVTTVQHILDRLQEEVDRGEVSDPNALRERLKELIKSIFPKEEPGQKEESATAKPYVILVVGVNGVG